MRTEWRKERKIELERDRGAIRRYMTPPSIFHMGLKGIKSGAF